MFLSTVIAAVAAFGQGPSAAAGVDDFQSHGTLGDNLLSLDEAIQLVNGTLTLAQLSVAEQARVTGTGAVLAIVVDASITPMITVQAPLTAIIGPTASTDTISVTGLGMPVLAGGAQATIMSLASRYIAMQGFRFEDGAVAIDAKMPAPPGMTIDKSVVGHCEFDGQTSAAVQLRADGTDRTRLMLHDATITNAPIGFRIDDQSNNGQIMSENERIALDGVDLGCRVLEDGNGSTTMWQFWRSTFVNGESLAKTTRSPTSDQLMMLRIVHSDATCTGDVIDMEGTTAGTSMVHHHHGEWVAGPGKRCLWTHPRTAQFDIHGSEMEFYGDIEIGAGTSTPRIWHQNNYYSNCTITLDNEGSLPNLVWNRYENCNIVVPPLARSPVTIRSSQLINTNADSQSFLAPISLQDSHRVSGTLTGFASETSPAPTEFLGTTSVTPETPQVGGNLQLHADLPPGISMFWDFATSFTRPTTSSEPVRFYGDPASVVILPVVVINQSTLLLSIPNNPALVGLEFYVQGVCVPWQPMPHAPAFYLPRGGLIRLAL